MTSSLHFFGCYFPSRLYCSVSISCFLVAFSSIVVPVVQHILFHRCLVRCATIIVVMECPLSPSYSQPLPILWLVFASTCAHAWCLASSLPGFLSCLFISQLLLRPTCHSLACPADVVGSTPVTYCLGFDYFLVVALVPSMLHCSFFWLWFLLLAAMGL